MKKLAKRLLLVLMTTMLALVTVFAVACGGGDEEEPQDPIYTVTGVVSSDMGPLSDVKVSVGESSKTTGKAGTYSFELTAGTYTLTYERTGYETVTKNVNTADANAENKITLNVSMSVKAKEYVTISGTVKNEAEAALEGVAITGEALSETVYTQADGTYTLPRLEKGDYTFHFGLSKYKTVSRSITAADVTDETYVMDVTLSEIPPEELFTISGTVKSDTTDSALSGVIVSVKEDAGNQSITDASGNYTITLVEGSYTIEFTKAGYGKIEENVTPADFTERTLTLDKTLTLNPVLAGMTNADLKTAFTTMQSVDKTVSLKKDTAWLKGGVAGSEDNTISEGYRMESKVDNNNDEYRRYIYGKLTVGEANKIFTFYGRTFGVQTEFAVKVINPTTMEWEFVKAKNSESDWSSLNSDTYTDFSYDLSKYNGQEIILALGVRKAALTIESVTFSNGSYVFGRTVAADLESVKTLDFTTKSYKDSAIPDAFSIMGNIEGDSKNAKFYACYVGENTGDDARLWMYAYAKATVTKETNRLSVQFWVDRSPYICVEAYDATTHERIMRVKKDSVMNEDNGQKGTTTVEVDLSECVGKNVILVIGMTTGERMELKEVAFGRMNYTLSGTVTLPSDSYDLSKVSFKLGDKTLTAGEDGFTFDTETGAYSLTLDAKVITGILTVGYDNTGLAETEQLVSGTFDISTLNGTDSEHDITLLKDDGSAKSVTLTVKISDALLTDEQAAMVTISFDGVAKRYDTANDCWDIGSLKLGQYAGKEIAIGFTQNSLFANIYNTQKITLTDEQFNNNESVELTVTLQEKEVLPGKTRTDLEAAKTLATFANAAREKDSFISSVWEIGGSGSSDAISEGYRITCGAAGENYGKYIYGKIAVTATNKMFAFYGRTFGTETEFAVTVIDVQTYASAIVKAQNETADWKGFNSSDFTKFTYDLSGYVGKTVIVVLGVRKEALTVETTMFTDGTVAFGRTNAQELIGLQKTEIASGNQFTADARDGSRKIQDAFVTVGAASVDNNRWMLTDARGENTVESDPFTYVYLKTTISNANARFTIRWSSYNNGTMATTKILALKAEDNSKIHLYSGNSSVSGEWCTSNFDFSECVGQDVILVIGMSRGNRMGIDYIKFERMAYTVTGTVTLPTEAGDAYDMSKVSFKLDGTALTAGQNGFTFDTATGVYSLTLDATVKTGTLTVSYDNTEIVDEEKQLVDSTVDLASLAIADNVSANISFKKVTVNPIDIVVTVKIGENTISDADAANLTLTLDGAQFEYNAEDDAFVLSGKKMKDAVNKTIAVIVGNSDNKFSNIYASQNVTLTADAYGDEKATLNVTLEEKELLPGLTYTGMQDAKYLLSDYYQGKQAHRVLKEFNFKGISGATTAEQNEGDTLQVQQNLNTTQNSDSYYGYIYGIKTLGANTSKLTLCVRRHNSEATFSVTIIDVETGAVWVSAKQTTDNQSYEYKSFDLSSFVGKRVLIAIGVYNVSGNENQFVIEHLRFFGTPTAGSGRDDKFTKEEWASVVNGLMTDELQYAAVQTKTSYTGENTKNIFSEWGYVSKSYADGEAAFESINEGFMMKTRQSSNDNSDNRAFIYNKFAITADNAMFAMTARTFGRATGIGFTVYYSDGTNVVSKVIKGSHTGGGNNAEWKEDYEDGWIRFKDDNAYATFTYDLSEFIGKDVVIVIGCRNLEINDECKLHIGNITLSEVQTTPSSEQTLPEAIVEKKENE